MKYILGINSAYHESSACLVSDGQLIAFAEEERFNKTKHGKTAATDNPDILPLKAIGFCLDFAGIEMKDVDAFGYSFLPEERLKNIGVDTGYLEGSWGSASGENQFYGKFLKIPEILSNYAQKDIGNKFIWIEHHKAHAASAFFVSPFEEASILTIDGIGEYVTTSLAIGYNNVINDVWQMRYPDSIGLLWEKIAKFLGFSEYDACKVMGLAAYGKSNNFIKSFNRIATITEREFCLDNSIISLRSDNCTGLEALLGKRRLPGEPLDDRHADVAAALQVITERIVVNLAKYLHKTQKSKNICLSGGVALNCVANSLIMKESGFENIFVQPVAHDAGTAIGAAFHIWNQVHGNARSYVMNDIYLGPRYSNNEIEHTLRKHELAFKFVENIEAVTAGLLSEGNIVGWFQGRMEAGPRALGNRSLLADPRSPTVKDLLNSKIKHREQFRPFAASILDEVADDWFEIGQHYQPLQYMLMVAKVRPDKFEKISSVIHIDGTCRIQLVKNEINHRYHCLIKEFMKQTDVPLLLNTSFNDSEPIVCCPEDAVNTFLKTGIDALVMNNFLILRADNANR